MESQWKKFKEVFEGDIHFDSLHQMMYATDASVFRKIPVAVAFPKSTRDIQQLVSFSSSLKIPLIPRAAGTSLAGQCVGEGIVVDISRYFTKILSLNPEEGTVTVQPGVIRDELNDYLEPFGLFFSPNTSTANRCTIGGMVGNNSSGSSSIRYGVTRDKVKQIKAVLFDGEEVVFKSISSEEFFKKMSLDSLEGEIYRQIYYSLESPEVRENIQKEFPKPSIHRRNTGYAIDELLKSEIFGGQEKEINLCSILCGSEGTLAFFTEITLETDVLPPNHRVMVAAHYSELNDCLKDVRQGMLHHLFTCEMMDDVILNCTKNNRTYDAYRFFIKENPRAILLMELRGNSPEDLEKDLDFLIKDLERTGRSYHNAVLREEECHLALELRKAGLGLLGNIVGDDKAVACIEDTAVALEDLPEYIEEFSALMEKYNQQAVYYAHAGAGELHLRPILNLKKKEDVSYFRQITTDVALLCKKYQGSFSGEHGDGIVRGEFIPLMIGEENYQILKEIKKVFDPENIFNPGKITDAFPMDESLRYKPDRQEPRIEIFMDFEETKGILRMAESCNGSGDCRKTEKAHGVMCPSFHVTKNEKDSTRARANVLREVLTHNSAENPFDSDELKEVLNLCISCKACSSECPSNVDVSAIKSEFLYQYYQTHQPSRAVKLFAKSTQLNRKASRFPVISNFIAQNKLTSSFLKRLMNIHPERKLPKFPKRTFQGEYKRLKNKISIKEPVGELYLFVDEFSNYLDVEVAVDAFVLLTSLGYKVNIIDHLDSGRALISKGFLKEAKREVEKNLHFLKGKISEEKPLIGIEPSSILSFRDEYLRLAENKEEVKQVAKNTYLIEEFLVKEIREGKISSDRFTTEEKEIKIHIHCHQKAMGNQKDTFDLLNLPKNFKPVIIPAGCCGMAGSFGFEKEHYEMSMAIGNLKLFPSIKKTKEDVIVVSNGTSCRQQIFDGTGRNALHAVSVLRNSLSG